LRRSFALSLSTVLGYSPELVKRSQPAVPSAHLRADQYDRDSKHRRPDSFFPRFAGVSKISLIILVASFSRDLFENQCKITDTRSVVRLSQVFLLISRQAVSRQP